MYMYFTNLFSLLMSSCWCFFFFAVDSICMCKYFKVFVCTHDFLKYKSFQISSYAVIHAFRD